MSWRQAGILLVAETPPSLDSQLELQLDPTTWSATGALCQLADGLFDVMPSAPDAVAVKFDDASL
jgi:hypothetical protein